MRLMKPFAAVVPVIVFISSLWIAHAEDKRDAQRQELDAIKTELKPLREKAYLEPDVIATRKKLDAAYKEYWDSVRGAMLRLDPSKKKLIEKDMAVRKATNAIPNGSRASDYEKKAKATEKKSE